MADSTSTRTYTLYVFHFSLYSIISRFTIALGAKTQPDAAGPSVELKLVNLHRKESVSEWFLNVTPRGQVYRTMRL